MASSPVAAAEDAAGPTMELYETYKATQAAAFKALSTFTVNYCQAFGGEPREVSDTLTEQAHALCLLLSNALVGITEHTEHSPFRSVHLACGIDGIKSLLALSLFIAGAKS